MKSIIALPDDYVVIDLETTGKNTKQDEITELAAIRYRSGQAVATYSQLVKTNKPVRGFVIMLTGITNEKLEDKPHIGDVIGDFAEFIGSDILIGHNIAAFDAVFIADAYEKYLGRTLENPCVDTLRIGKKVCPGLPSYSLEALSAYLGVDYFCAHRGAADCEITNECYQKMREIIRNKHGEQEFLVSCEKRTPKKKVTDIVPTGEINCNNPLYHKRIVFTGSLSVSRKEAAQMAVNMGAIPQAQVTSKTDFLVTGTQDLDRIGLDGMSNKEESAFRLNQEGKANIQIITEAEFIALVTTEDQLQIIEETSSCTELSGTASTEDAANSSEVAPPEERKAFELVYPELKDILMDAPLDSGVLIFQALSNSSSIYFLDSNELFFRIRLRKKSKYILIPECYECLLPSDTQTVRTKSDEGMVRILITCHEDILKYVPVLRAALQQICRRHRDFGCCSRYEACSDARKCLHPDPKFSIRCWYQQNLVDGKIFYGKNKI